MFSRLNEYQDATEATAIYPRAGEAANGGLNYAIMGLCGEAGELANRYKKTIRDDHGEITAQAHIDLVSELGDILWYLARVATELKVSLSTVANRNIGKLEARRAQKTLHDGPTRAEIEKPSFQM